MDIHSIFDFIKLTNKFRSIKRLVSLVGEDRMENDVEHSYQLALLAWYILSAKETNLNKDLIIKYALVHDFVEIYAGDTWFYRSKDEDENKKKREKDSAERLKIELSSFNDFHKLIEDYENQVDKESQFVYALDKIIPILNIYLNEGENWKTNKVTFDDLIKNKTPKIAISPELEPYFKELVVILEENKHMFHEKHE